MLQNLLKDNELHFGLTFNFVYYLTPIEGLQRPLNFKKAREISKIWSSLLFWILFKFYVPIYLIIVISKKNGILINLTFMNHN